MICNDGWYKFYKVAFRNKLDLFSKRLSNDVFEKLIRSKKNSGEFQYIVNSHMEEELSDYDIKEVVFVIDLFSISFSVSGNYLPDQKSIIINIRVSPKMLLKDYNILPESFEKVKLEVKYAIRHELEHAYYNKINDYSTPNYKLQNNVGGNMEFSILAKNYLLDPSEIDSYIRELMLKAKNKRVPIDNLLEEMVVKKVTEIAPDTMKKDIENKTKNGIIYKSIIDEILATYRNRMASIYNFGRKQ